MRDMGHWSRHWRAHKLDTTGIEAVAVVHVLAVVVAESLFVQIAEQVKRLSRNVCAVDAAVQQAPEVLKAVRVDLAINVLYGVVHDLMLEFVQTVVRREGIGVERATRFNVCLRTSVWIADFLRFGMTFVRTLPPRSRIPMTGVLSLPHVPVIRSARLPACAFRALSPIKVSSASTSPVSLSTGSMPSANRMRCSMNQAVFCVTPMARWTSYELMPLLQFTICHMAVSHMPRPIGDSSNMVPVFKVN
jgi:hypothetical protein